MNPIRRYLGSRVEVWTGDLTAQAVDAIVNAANSTLLGGGGVDGAIHDAAGPRLLDECREIRRTRFPDGLPTGEAVVTGGASLAARFVIHTVGPIYGSHDGREAELLTNCYRNSLELAAHNRLRSVAFPAISTGAYGYPKAEAAGLASRAVLETLERLQTVELVRFVFFHRSDADIFIAAQHFG